MEPTLFWSLRTPAHIIFVLDQSGSMDGAKAEIVSKNVQNALVDIINGCIAGPEVVKRRAYISIIGYGLKNNPINLIRNGWVDEWAEDVLTAKKRGECIVPPTSEWSTPFDECFLMVHGMIQEWIEIQRNKQLGDLGPIIVINITDGVVEDDRKTNIIAKKILTLQNTWLFNILIPEYENVELVLPNNKYCLNGTGIDTECRLFFDICSTIPDEAVYLAKSIGLDGVNSNSRGLIVSTNDKSASLITGIMCHN